MDLELIRKIESYAAHAWPAREVTALQGWSLRSNLGITRRANSVLAEAHGSERGLAEKLDHVEVWYAERGQPARYQLCPASAPPDLDRILATRGYRATATTLVQVASLVTVVSNSGVTANVAVRRMDVPDDAWLQAYGAAEDVRPAALEARRAILGRITRPTCYLLIEAETQAVATGLAVLHGDWAGLFCVATHAAWRRRGLATCVVRGLAEWAMLHGATQAYLQVMQENVAACALYARLGFSTLYSYHYRERIKPSTDVTRIHG